jgi:hypothetical protein
MLANAVLTSCYHATPAPQAGSHFARRAELVRQIFVEDDVMRTHKPLLAIAVFLLLGACVQTVRWEKPQATEQAAAADLDDCRVQAQREAFHMVGPYPAGYPFYGPSPYNTWRYDYAARLRQEQWFAEGRLTTFCMRNKGYERVVVENAKT